MKNDLEATVEETLVMAVVEMVRGVRARSARNLNRIPQILTNNAVSL